MIDNKVLVGYAPTRRRIFSVEDALKYKKLIADKLKALEIEFVDLEDLNDEGLLRCADDVDPVGELEPETEQALSGSADSDHVIPEGRGLSATVTVVAAPGPSLCTATVKPAVSPEVIVPLAAVLRMRTLGFTTVKHSVVLFVCDPVGAV
jgi:hypothetical protein